MDRFNRRDALFFAICALVIAISATIAVRYFESAFPEASIEFRYNRTTSQPLAESALRRVGITPHSERHAASFEHDDNAKIFLERKLGLRDANRLMRSDVRVWFWRHRWFTPLQKEEFFADIAPTGEIVRFEHVVREDAPAPPLTMNPIDAAMPILRAAGVNPSELRLVAQSQRALPRRTDTTLVWESTSIRPAGAPYRYTVTLHGGAPGRFEQELKVPDDWLRGYAELRSKNIAAGYVDQVFFIATIAAIITIFIFRLRRGDIRIRFVLGVGAVCAVLLTAVSLNSLPSDIAAFDTNLSWGAFLTRDIFFAVAGGIGAGLALMIIVGAGEVLFRERYPQHLAIPRLFSFRSLRSKRVFKSFFLGYTLVALFLGYQVVFYLVASKYGAWAPAEIPYDDILNTAFPWVAVLFMGFFPAFSEEFMSRAFSIPFFERILKSRIAAIVLAGFIWGFGHAAYPNQPFYIRGLEVGIAGVVIGILMNRFGLLPLLVWHYTVDALYTSLLLFRSHDLYYIASGAACALVFAFPMIASLFLYVRSGGFEPDEQLDNSTIPISKPLPKTERREVTELGPAIPVSRRLVAITIVAIAAAIALATIKPPSLGDVVEYPITKRAAREIASRHLASIGERAKFERSITIPVAGFRSWDADSPREEGGTPGAYDHIAIEYLLRNHLGIPQILDIERHSIPAATWMSRFFTPLQKDEAFVEVDPRTKRVVGYHKYQDERTPGAQLDSNSAIAIAKNEFPRFGLDASAFDLKETLSFQEPSRRDWLFHFDEKKPLAPEASRRVSVRVAGATVSEFAPNVRIPERFRREASAETVLNTILLVLRSIGGLALLFAVVGGCVIAIRRRRVVWRRAGQATIALAIFPIATVVLQKDQILASYGTSIAWQTFLVTSSVSVIVSVAAQIGAIFLALAMMTTIFPNAWSHLSRDGRSRFGRSAVVAALATCAIAACVAIVLSSTTAWFPNVARGAEPAIPSVVATPLAAIPAIWEAIRAAVVLSAIVAAISLFVRSRQLRERKVTEALVVLAAIASVLDPSVLPSEFPLNLARAVLVMIMTWLSIRFVLAKNRLAYPAAFFAVAALDRAVAMFQNHRTDLTINGGAVAVVVIAVMVWLATARRAELKIEN